MPVDRQCDIHVALPSIPSDFHVFQGIHSPKGGGRGYNAFVRIEDRQWKSIVLEALVHPGPRSLPPDDFSFASDCTRSGFGVNQPSREKPGGWRDPTELPYDT